MENIIVYAPYAVFVVIFLIQINIFARTSDVKAIEAKLMTYAMEHFVTQSTYNLNHKALQENLTQIRQDISDVRNLLINISSHNITGG
jgi:uncharacterized membrane protein